MSRRKPIGRFRSLLAAAIPVLLLAGCDGQAATTGAIGEFIAGFARHALAAFLL